jgi:hypothetical protein
MTRVIRELSAANSRMVSEPCRLPRQNWTIETHKATKIATLIRTMTTELTWHPSKQDTSANWNGSFCSSRAGTIVDGRNRRYPMKARLGGHGLGATASNQHCLRELRLQEPQASPRYQKGGKRIPGHRLSTVYSASFRSSSRASAISLGTTTSASSRIKPRGTALSDWSRSNAPDHRAGS